MQSKKQEQHDAAKKKVLFIITKSNFGGAQKYVYELATSLPSNLFDVRVALGGDGILKEKLKSKNITVITIPYLERDISILKEFQVFSFLYKHFKSEAYDAIHLNSSKIGGIGSLAGRLASIKNIIFTAHGWAFNENRSFLSKLVIKISYFATLLLSTQTIAVSNSIKAQVSSWPIVNKKIVIIHNGVSQIAYVTKEAALEKLSIKESGNAVAIGTLAELHHIKGLDILLEAISNVKDVHDAIHLYIFGEGEERKNIERLIQDLHIGKHVTLLGYIDNATKYLKVLDIFVLASRSEALSLAVLEAGLAELPVIATSVGGIPEIIISEKDGILVAKENVDELTVALLTMIEDKKFRHTMAESLNKKVLEEFSQEQMVNRTLELY